MFNVSPGVSTTETSVGQVVQAVGTTTGALAGYFSWGPVFSPQLISSANNMAKVFYTPTNWNYETWFSGSNFLDYGSALWVARTANCTPNTTGANLAANASSQFPNNSFNAIAVPFQGYLNGNTPNAAVVLSSIVLNSSDFSAKYANGYFNTNSVAIAKYPGAPGNSLRVGLCMSPTQFNTPNLQLSGTISGGTANGNSFIGSITFVPGSNTANLIFTSTAGSNVAAGNSYANNFIASFFARGDILNVNTGNRIQPTQALQLTNIGVATTNTTNTVVKLSFSQKYSGSQNISSNAVSRQWQYAQFFSVPNTWISTWQGQSSSPNTQDIVLGIVVDEDGAFTGTPNTILETYNGLSRATDAVDSQGNPLFYRNVINQNSSYIWLVNDLPNAPSNTAAQLVNANNGSTPWDASLQCGQDGAQGEANANLGDLMNGWQLFSGRDNYSINLVVSGKPVGGSAQAGINGTTYNNFFMADWLINNLGETRRDCVVFFSPDKNIVVNNIGNEVTDVPNWASLVTPSTYAVMDTGYKYMFDKYNNTWRWVPLNGDVAGTCVFTDAVAYPWYSPAGPNRGMIKNVTKLGWNPQQDERDIIYPLSINPVCSIKGLGTLLYGDRTFTQQTSDFRSINIRRLFLYMETAIAAAARYTLFELNDIFTQNQFTNMVEPFLQGIASARGIEEDFAVICNGNNNPPAVVDAGEFLCAVLVRPLHSINFIRIDFFSVGGAISFSAVAVPSA